LPNVRSDGPFTTAFYNDDDGVGTDNIAGAVPSRRPVWAIAPESFIVRPAPDTVVAVGEFVQIWGWAWSYRGISAVEVSVDGGASFDRALLEPRRGWIVILGTTACSVVDLSTPNDQQQPELSAAQHPVRDRVRV